MTVSMRPVSRQMEKPTVILTATGIAKNHPVRPQFQYGAKNETP